MLKRTGVLKFVLAALLVARAASAWPVWATADKVPFQPGEILTYEIKWCGIPAGQAVLSVLPMQKINGREAYHFELA